jgi:Ca2+-binding EF-hand superfamily protein
MRTNGPTVRTIFNRVDQDGDGAVSRDEVKAVLKKAGVGDGILGPIKVSLAAGSVLDRFDADGDDRVTYSEFVQKGAEMLKATAWGSADAVESLIRESFTQVDSNSDGAVTPEEVVAQVRADIEAEGGLLAQLPGFIKAFAASQVADATARVAVDLLDMNGDQAISKRESDRLCQDVISLIPEQ